MRARTIPTPGEIVLRVHLKRVADVFRRLSEKYAVASTKLDGNELPDGAPEEIVNELRKVDADCHDLMAIRQSPCQFSKGASSEAYQWVWLLHRFTNRYMKGGF